MRISITDKDFYIPALNVLSSGGILAYPTDTLYGFGVDATNPVALRRLNQLKNRQGPMSVIAPDIATVRTWIDCSDQDWDLIKTRLGGPTTVIAPVKAGICDPLVLGVDKTLGIRVPDCPEILRLVKKFGRPITTTSVNRSGGNPLNNPVEIEAEFGDLIDLVLDGGVLPASTGSVIYRWTLAGLEVVRP